MQFKCTTYAIGDETVTVTETFESLNALETEVAHSATKDYATRVTQWAKSWDMSPLTVLNGRDREVWEKV